MDNIIYMLFFLRKKKILRINTQDFEGEISPHLVNHFSFAMTLEKTLFYPKHPLYLAGISEAFFFSCLERKYLECASKIPKKLLDPPFLSLNR